LGSVAGGVRKKLEKDKGIKVVSAFNYLGLDAADSNSEMKKDGE
jgi:hypothetical protein